MSEPEKMFSGRRDPRCGLSQSLHHVRDKAMCARELDRVLRPASHILARGTFSDPLDGFPTLFRFFPARS